MLKAFLLQLLLVSSVSCFAQMLQQRSLSELIMPEAHGWKSVQLWMQDAKNTIEVLPKDSLRADSALVNSQVTTNSPMGAIVYETGGILIDSGWIRILGSGSSKLDRSLMSWNKDKSYIVKGQRLSFLLVADDVLGGFFAINAGGIDQQNIGNIYYFSPESISWVETDMKYSDFIYYCFHADLTELYDGLKWDDWKSTTENLDGNEGVFCFPYLWTEEGKNINQVERSIVPIQELWSLNFK